MLDKTNLAVNTVIVTSVDDTEIQRDYDKYHKAAMFQYVDKMCNRIKSLYVDVIPRDYKQNKMHMEAKRGAYDLAKAREVLKRKKVQ